MTIFALMCIFFFVGSVTATGSFNCSADNSTCEPFCYTDTDCKSGYFCDRCPTLDVDLKLHTCRRNQAYMPTSIAPAIETLREVETFLSRNPTDIVTIFIDDYVPTKKGGSVLFKRAGLEKYLSTFPG